MVAGAKEVVVGPPVEEGIVDVETAGGTDDVDATDVGEAEGEFGIVEVTSEGSVADGVWITSD